MTVVAWPAFGVAAPLAGGGGRRSATRNGRVVQPPAAAGRPRGRRAAPLLRPRVGAAASWPPPLGGGCGGRRLHAGARRGAAGLRAVADGGRDAATEAARSTATDAGAAADAGGGRVVDADAPAAAAGVGTGVPARGVEGALPPPPPADDGKLPAQRARRAYSNVDPVAFQRRPGSTAAAAALVAGTTVGAGVLALPAVTASSGFGPSSAALAGVWAVACVQALLLAETAVNTQCALGRPSAVSILSMARATLGDAGGAATAAAYGLLHVAILTAFTAQGGTIVAEQAAAALGTGGWPDAAGAPAFAGALGAFLYAASDGLVAAVNNVLVAATVATFVGLVAATAGQFQPDALLGGAHWSRVIPDAMPVLLVSLVFHNVVPYVCSYLEGDRTKIRLAVVGGSALPLLMFLVWNGVILGSADVQAAAAAAAAAATTAASAAAAAAGDAGGAAADGATGALVSAFSLLAVTTSYVGVVAGLTDFFNDGLLSARLLTAAQVRRADWLAYALTLGPPTAFAVAAPDAFFGALDVAGAFGVSVLFGLLPCAMAWRARYAEGVSLGVSYPPLVPGGRPLLVAMAAAPAAILVSEAAERLQRLLG
ncbi:hypothetical protein BU14_0051s0025 [Porphyra umbilicalis]|uniref:Amino acid transporter transmembrane domain-containing protein n=1 Tax=Porphyra umbilicalis TaxID=2786 RepID=A0A1X6PI55_PORUM|nr:hypothetical protein BU14_0051s0025 [Porphyra umbilicalis]|eukprot:OSX80505.1 hypothetical protein BU14_0051s0025 [Porphyra umbilicalis]